MILESLNNLFFDLLFIIINFLLFLLLFVAYKKLKNYFGNNILLKFIFFFINVKLVLYYLLPSLFRIYSSYQFEIEDHVKIFDLLRVYIIELVSWIFWLLGFVIILIIKGNSIKSNDQILTQNFKESKHLLLIFAIGSIIQTFYSISLNTPNIIFSLFGQLFFYAGLSVGPILLLFSKRLYNKFYLLVGLICFSLSLLSLSTRGAFVYSILFLTFIIFFIIRSQKAKFAFIFILSMLIIAFIFSGSVINRVSIDENGLNFIPKEISEKSDGRTFAQEIEWRFGASTRIGTGFLVMYDEGLRAGINPIKHSLLGFLPRSIDPNKPHPSTLDGQDFFSQGMYLIMAKVEGNPTSMVEFPTGCHFYWEFGTLGVIILSIISGIYIGACYILFKKFGLVSIPLMLSTFKPWGYVEPKIWVSDIAMQLYQIIIPFIVLVFFYRLIQMVLNLKFKKIV